MLFKPLRIVLLLRADIQKWGPLREAQRNPNTNWVSLDAMVR
jgi:hypothetical protein